MPVKHFIAATNVNDTVPQFMKTGEYQPKPSTATISNAMDVGDPVILLEFENYMKMIFRNLKRTFLRILLTMSPPKQRCQKFTTKQDM